MKAVILAGGRGSRLGSDTAEKPKAMVEIGGKPILWHLMKNLSASQGISEFIICAGYRSWSIKEYFASYFLRHSHVTFDLARNKMGFHECSPDPWSVTILETGEDTGTAGRLKQAENFIEESFLLTYCDVLTDLQIPALAKFHRDQNAIATIATVQPRNPYGVVKADEKGKVESFSEKPLGTGEWINAGFFMMEPEIFDHIEDDSAVLEENVLPSLALTGRVSTLRYHGFWHAMDTVKDRMNLESLWHTSPSWKNW